MGRRVAALFVLRPAPSSTRGIVAYMRASLAPHKTPRHWFLVEAFPLTGSGKIQKFKLRELWRRARCRHCDARNVLHAGNSISSIMRAICHRRNPCPDTILIIASMLVFLISASRRKQPSPDAMNCAQPGDYNEVVRSVQGASASYPAKALSPRWYRTGRRLNATTDAMMPMIVDAFTPYYTAMVDGIATIYANILRPASCANRGVLSSAGRAKASRKGAGAHAAEQCRSVRM